MVYLADEHEQLAEELINQTMFNQRSVFEVFDQGKNQQQPRDRYNNGGREYQSVNTVSVHYRHCPYPQADKHER